jgi:YjjG family noncanonical pyrimidine nucleotidase
VTEPKYAAILFDLDDTLLDFSTCEIQALRRAFTMVDINTSDDEWLKFWHVYRPISSNYWQQKQSRCLSRQQVIEASLEDAFKALNDDLADSAQLAQIYWETFCCTACLNLGVTKTVKSLSDTYKLGIVTNGYTDSQESRLKASGLANYFQSVIISESVGYRKPAPEIFNLALKELQVTPNEALFVGDSISHDYQGAINAGIDFCYYQKRSQLPDLDPQSKYTIKNMSQLINLLKGDLS